jgi:rhodanese-related sulfurtransferase
MSDCTVEELHTKREAGEEFLLLDVRTEQELAIASIDGATHVPMDAVEARLEELHEHRDNEIVVMCHHGGRSAMVQGFLKKAGFNNVRNLLGGIDAYSAKVDQSIPRY